MWPAHYFVMGSEAEQNGYFLDLNSRSEAVYQFHYDVGEVRPVVAAMLADFATSLVEMVASKRATEIRKPHRSRHC